MAKNLTKGLKAQRERLLSTIHARENVRLYAGRPLGEFYQAVFRHLSLENVDVVGEFLQAEEACTRWATGKGNFDTMLPYLKRFSFALLCRPDGAASEVFYAWLDLWERAVLGDLDAEQQFRVMHKALGSVPRGRKRQVPYEQKQSDTRRRVQHTRERQQAAKQTLQIQLDTIRKERASIRNPLQRVRRIQQEQDALLAHALQSSDKPTRSAAKALKLKLTRERKHLLV